MTIAHSDIIVTGKIAKGYIGQKIINHLKSMGILV